MSKDIGFDKVSFLRLDIMLFWYQVGFALYYPRIKMYWYTVRKVPCYLELCYSLSSHLLNGHQYGLVRLLCVNLSLNCVSCNLLQTCFFLLQLSFSLLA